MGGEGTSSTTKRHRKRSHGVFCLEGDWWHVKDKTTVEPALALLQTNGDLAFDYIHRDVGTVEELEYYLDKWVQRGLSKYPILYLGFHGEPGRIFIGDGRKKSGRIDLDWLEMRLGGRCAGKLIHFGSCGTMAIHGHHGHRLNRFLRRTEAMAVCGYTDDTYWLDTAAFEILLLAQLQYVSWTRRGMGAVKRRIVAQASGLARALKFRMVIG
jgi:hypothetical protein